MKEITAPIARRRTFTQFTLCIGCGVLLSFLFTAMAQCSVFPKLAAEAEEACSTVVWYVQGGYWREDVKTYLTHAENVLCPNSDAASRISLEEADE